VVALTRAYLGDVAIAAPVPGPAIAVRVERHFQPTFGHARLIPIGAGRVSALAATMDYRADVLVTWQQGGAIYAHMLRASGLPDPTQRLGASAPGPQLQALVSDNGRGMIAWSSTNGGPVATTRVYLARSAPGPRFAAPRALASFLDPLHVGQSPGSLALIRLSTENVMIAWTDAEHGHYAVRAAPAVFAATRPSARLSNPDGQAVLAGLAPGPAGEAVALWKTAPGTGSGFDERRTELWAARSFIARHDRPAFQRPEMVAPAGPTLLPGVAVDPADDRAVAAWLRAAPEPRIEYAVGPDAGRHTPPPTDGMVHWLRIFLLAGVAAAALALLGVTMWRRGRARAA
jgi:hypothetical protein